MRGALPTVAAQSLHATPVERARPAERPNWRTTEWARYGRLCERLLGRRGLWRQGRLCVRNRRRSMRGHRRREGSRLCVTSRDRPQGRLCVRDRRRSMLIYMGRTHGWGTGRSLRRLRRCRFLHPSFHPPAQGGRLPALGPRNLRRPAVLFRRGTRNRPMGCSAGRARPGMGREVR